MKLNLLVLKEFSNMATFYLIIKMQMAQIFSFFKRLIDVFWNLWSRI